MSSTHKPTSWHSGVTITRQNLPLINNTTAMPLEMDDELAAVNVPLSVWKAGLTCGIF